MNKHNLLGLSITFLLIFVFIPSQSIETNDFPSYLNEMEITIPIEIHVWSDRDEIKEFLETNVHANIIQESEYPRNNSTDIWQVRLNNNFYGLNNKIDYTILRFFNIYGIGQSPEYAGVITKFLKNISNELDKLFSLLNSLQLSKKDLDKYLSWGQVIS